MSEKHTPGPWTRGEGTWSSHVIAPTKYGSDELTSFHGRGRDEDDANAALTAAAPDMLEALEEIWPYIEEDDGGFATPGYQGAINKVRAAIAKARGQA